MNMIGDFYRFLTEMNEQPQMAVAQQQGAPQPQMDTPQPQQQPQVGGNDQQPLGAETNLVIKGVDVHFDGHKLFVVQGENSFDLKLKPSQKNDLLTKMQGMVQATGGGGEGLAQQPGKPV
jgi:hypothetical protein